ncbi:flavin-containing monooxygenase [Roseateles violae]|uniref:NAD(P)/FAD-dependent oxidoreductase n=1 Tax=Roseateles violae TaxID=3058042 RepID=A0ABT8DRN4_9BURK|nr:NAD(P)/FAD-dependent oxidoreductase [Pelomonas sp. PFR6]MDN3918959.1 NAD(P)/FAD-dependent oxidoreductase [Pelomonas sp. PFR6]
MDDAARPDPERTTEPPGAALDVLIVGAGLSGIGAARHLQRRCPEQRFEIVEARERLGGTWDLFRYPGVRSDSDIYTLGYGFKPWTGRQAITEGPAILDYIRETAEEGGLAARIRYGHRVVGADWSSEAACWRVELEADGRRRQLNARFLYLCCGYYSYAGGHRPSFEGEAEFRGTIALPQFWPAELDHAGQRVVVIGSGATAVTLVPAMARTAAHVTMLQRSPSYVVSRPSVDAIAQGLRRVMPEAWAYALTRWKNVAITSFYYRLARRRPGLFKQRLQQLAAAALGSAEQAAAAFTPRYEPWDQRLCVAPDGDLFQALRESRASIVTDTIERFTPGGLRLAGGRELAADIVVMATGLKLNVLGDIAVRIDGRPLDASAQMAYKGMMLSEVPNMVMAFGYTNASWTLKADLTAAWVCRLLRHMRRHGQRIAVPRRDPSVASEPFLSFSSGYVQRALAALPKQGNRRPWQVHQNYFADLRAIRWGRIADGVLQLSPDAQPIKEKRR